VALNPSTSLEQRRKEKKERLGLKDGPGTNSFVMGKHAVRGEEGTLGRGLTSSKY